MLVLAVVHAPNSLDSDWTRGVCLTAFFACLLLSPPDLFAGQGRGMGASLSGIVRDSTGLVLPGATVEIGPTGAPLTQSTVSAADGTFVFPDGRVGSDHRGVAVP